MKSSCNFWEKIFEKKWGRLVVVALVGFFVWGKSQSMAAGLLAEHDRFSGVFLISGVVAECEDVADCQFLAWQHALALGLFLKTQVDSADFAWFQENFVEAVRGVSALRPLWVEPFLFHFWSVGFVRAAGLPIDREKLRAQGRQTIAAVCDEEKFSKIRSGNFVEFLAREKNLGGTGTERVCRDGRAAQVLGFVAAEWDQDLEEGIFWYKVAALSPNAPDFLVKMPQFLAGYFGEWERAMVQRFLRADLVAGTLSPEADKISLELLLGEQKMAVERGFAAMILAWLSEADATGDCAEDRACQREIVREKLEKLRCENPQEIQEIAVCEFVAVGLAEGWLGSGGEFRHPEAGVGFAWRSDRGQRWLKNSG